MSRGTRRAPDVAQTTDAVLAGMRALGGDHRGVTSRELSAQTGYGEREVRGALSLARAQGRVSRLGASPTGSALYGLTSLDVLDPFISAG